MGHAYAQPRLVAVYRMLREGSIAKAKAACRRLLRETPDDAAATHLLGLIHKAEGDFATAERCMLASIELAPTAAEYRANLGNVLRDIGRTMEAESAYREALALDPASRPARLGLVRTLADIGNAVGAEIEAREFVRLHGPDTEGCSLLAMSLRKQGRLEDAEAMYRKALDIAPNHAATHHNLGSLWSRMDRPEEALDALERAKGMGVRGYEIAFNFGRTYLQLYRFDEAEQAFAEAVAARPRDIDAQINLARVRFMRKDENFARDIADAARRYDDDPRLGMLFGIMMRRAGFLESAETQLEAVIERHGRAPEAVSALAEILHEAGRPGDARTLVLEAVEARPQDPAIAECAIAVLLSCGDAKPAMHHIAKQRERDPLGQGWLAYEALAARLGDRDRYRALYDFDRLIRVYELGPPDGWNSMAELNAALVEALGRRHGFPAHPLDQSLRNGSQTARSLLTDPDPAIRGIMAAFAEPLEDYRQALGSERAHPVSARNEGPAKITGAWSVQLRRKGYHVNHFHPQGWISSAYYVAAPDEVNDTSRMPGWLKFGEPRFPVPGVNAERFIRPKAGRLVLFPSCMWHGTNPIQGNVVRTTIAFDASPTTATDEKGN